MKLNFEPFGRPLVFGPSGIQARHDFVNGYGVSVIKHQFSYGNEDGLYELAVFKGDDLCYDSGITDEVIGRITLEEAEEIADRVAALNVKQPSP